MTRPPGSKTITESERARMFKYYMEHDKNMSDTAREFKRNRKTLYRVAIDDDWEGREQKISDDVKKKTDQSIVAAEITNIRRARAILNRELKAYLGRREGFGHVAGMVALMKYIDEQETPTGTGTQPIGNLVQIIATGQISTVDLADAERRASNARVGLNRLRSAIGDSQ